MKKHISLWLDPLFQKRSASRRAVFHCFFSIKSASQNSPTGADAEKRPIKSDSTFFLSPFHGSAILQILDMNLLHVLPQLPSAFEFFVSKMSSF